MGNDGGVIAVKRKFMRHGKTKENGEKVEKEKVLMKRATSCSLTDEPLEAPIVVDDLGNLFNKAPLIERLLERTIPEQFGHIASLKDVTNCNFTSTITATKTGRFACPITMIEMNGRQPFVVIRSCGCVVSDKAMREVKTSECLVCNKSFDRTADLLPLVPTDAQIIEDLREKMHMRKEKRKKVKSTSSKKKKTESKRLKALEDTSHSQKRAKVVDEAAKAVQEEKTKSAVYSSLFSKREKKSASELLMSGGGIRYTLS